MNLPKGEAHRKSSCYTKCAKQHFSPPSTTAEPYARAVAIMKVRRRVIDSCSGLGRSVNSGGASRENRRHSAL